MCVVAHAYMTHLIWLRRSRIHDTPVVIAHQVSKYHSLIRGTKAPGLDFRTQRRDINGKTVKSQSL